MKTNVRYVAAVLLLVFIGCGTVRDRDEATLYQLNIWGAPWTPSFSVRLREGGILSYSTLENSKARPRLQHVTISQEDVARLTEQWKNALSETARFIPNLADGTKIRLEGRVGSEMTEKRIHVGGLKDLEGTAVRNLVRDLQEMAPSDVSIY